MKMSVVACVPEDSGRRHLRLADEVFGEGQGRAKILTATSRAVLGKVRRGFVDEVSIGDQVLEGQQRCTVRCHTFMMRRDCMEGKSSQFSINALLRHYPEVSKVL